MSVAAILFVSAIWFAAGISALFSVVSLFGGFFPAMAKNPVDVDDADKSLCWFIGSTIAALLLSSLAAYLMGL